MNQIATGHPSRADSYSDVMRKGVNVTLAAKVLKRCMEGGDDAPTVQQERVAIVVFNKMVPSYAAIILDVVDHRPTSIHDLNAMLLSNGLAALDADDTLAIEHQPDTIEPVAASPSPDRVGQVLDNVEKKRTRRRKIEAGAPPGTPA